MPRHTDSTVSSVKQAIDIVTLVADYGFNLNRAGSKYKVLCPFHADHRPSLELNPERQSFKCWACGAGGDVFDFVQRIERVEFPEALRMLAERAGIALQSEVKSDSEPTLSKVDLRSVCAWALAQFRDALGHDYTAGEYVRERGISPELAERFRLGFSPDERDWLIRRATDAGIDLAALETAGLVARNDEGTITRDRFRGRIMFPIHDLSGRCIAFGGRVLPAAERQSAERGFHLPKYVNSPETPLFQKRRNLYGIDLARDEARRTGWVAVVEGYTDVIAAHEAGLANVVGTLGTALGDDHVPLLKRLAQRVILVFDGDEAGQNAAQRALEIFMSHDVDARVLVLPAGLDPCDFLTEYGADAFRTLVDSAVDPLEFVLDRAAKRYDLESAEGTRQASESLLALLARVPLASRAGLDLKMAKSLDVIAHRMHVPVDALRRRLRELRRRAVRPNQSESSVNGVGDQVESAAIEPPIDQRSIDPLDAEVVRIVLHEPSLVTRLTDTVTPDDLTHPTLRELLAACFALHEEGEAPTFENVSARVGETARSLAAGLLLPVDPQPTSKWVPATCWSDRLDGVLRQRSQRAWHESVERLERRLAEVDRLTNPEEYESIRRVYLQLHKQRPDTKKSAAS